nr:uncharacterized protein LOC104704124 [Ipomoea batatas]
MLSTAFSGRSGHLWRQQHEARGLEVSIEISPRNGNPPSMYKSRSDMNISPEEGFSEEVKYIFSPFPVSWSVNEFASKIDVVTPLDLIINYAIPQRGKDVRGRGSYGVLHDQIRSTKLKVRGVDIDLACPCCNEEDDTIGHALFKCKEAQAVWHLSPYPDLVRMFQDYSS